MSNIDLSKMITAEDKAAEELTAAKDAANRSVVAWIDGVTHAITGLVPEDEKNSWIAKELAARAVLAANATTEQALLISAEAQVSGETDTDLAAKIVDNAVAYQAAIALLSGLRRKAAAEIEAALTPQEAIEAVTLAKEGWAEAQAN